MRHRILAFALLSVFIAGPATAWVVTIADPANIAKTAALAVLERFTSQTNEFSYQWIRRMARRLAVFEDLARYVAGNRPLWRTWMHDERLDETTAFMDALNN